MSQLSKMFFIALLMIPFVSNGQSISSNLRYINEQFSKYNKYETSFKIDEYNKEIICEDKFGILKAKFADIEIRTKGNNLGIFCINSENQCIRSYKKDGTLNASGYSDYTMGLRENEKLIPHINTVLNKFSEIKNEVLGTSNSSSTYTTNSNTNIEAELSSINAIFQRASQYKNIYSVDYNKKQIIASTKSCKTYFPAAGGTKFYYYKRESGNYSYGFYGLNNNKTILESCTSFENFTEKSYEYVDNYSDAQKVITSLNNILENLRGNSTNNSNDLIEKNITQINQIFQRSSEYKNTWRFDYNQNAIIGKTKNCEVIVPINSGLSIVNYEREGNYGNGWYFTNSDKSIIESCTSFKNNTIKTYEYVNNAADARRVIGAFNEIIRSRQSGGSSTSNSNFTNSGSGSISNNLSYINEQFTKYNAYNTRFRIDNSTKQLIWSHEFGTNYAYLKDVEVRADYTNDWIGVYCINNGKCIWQINNSGTRSEYKEYTMSLKEDGNMIGHMNTVINKFAELKRLALGNSNFSNSNSDDSDSPD